MLARRALAGAVVAAVLLPATALTAARLLQPGGTWGAYAVALAPLGLPLHAALALVLVPAVALRAGRTPYAAPAAVAVLGSLLHAVWWAPHVTGDPPPPEPGAPTLTVMSANLLAGRADERAVIGAARQEGVDVLVVEEVTDAWLEGARRAGLDALLPHRAGSPGERVDGTMVLSRLPLSDARALPTGFGTWRVVVDGRLSLLAVHTTAPTDMDRWRTDHATVLAEVEARPVDLLAGDLNATSDHRPMRRLADAGLRDASELLNHGWVPTWPANGARAVLRVPLPPLARIDHVLLGPSLAPVRAWTVPMGGTDHLAVIAEVAPRAA